jgi:hypothetical protein
MAKGKKQIQSEAETARKKAVDAKNEQEAAKDKAKMDSLANTPLTPEELAFCQEIEPKMNNGRRDKRPGPADILRYSKLKGRMNVNDES